MERPISDQEYRARWDAESLAKAEEIKADPVRFSRAKNAAVKIAEEKRKELTGINRVAKGAKTSKTTQESTQNRIIIPNVKPKTVKRPGKRPGTGFNVFKKI